LAVALVRIYQRTISPLLPRCCKFYPTCSEYMVQVLQRRGLWRGLAAGLWRILRCNPFSKGGYDPAD